MHRFHTIARLPSSIRAASVRTIRRMGWGGRAALVFLIILSIVAWGVELLPFGTAQQDLQLRLLAPLSGVESHGFRYILGADQLGRPLLLRIIEGGQVSLLVGALVPLVAFAVGVPIGLISGFFGGKLDRLLMRTVDIWMSLPPLLLALTVLYVTGSGFGKTILVIAALRWMLFARLTRALTLAAKERLFVEAARAIGATKRRIMVRHILPECLGELLILGALESARAILAEASLSFLGLGIQPPDSSWGTMLSTGRTYMFVDPWLVLLPGIAILATTLSINVVVDSYRGAAEQAQVRGAVERGLG